jgi:hypothetical protein
MALRAMGCSLMGVSKVFLRHVAPTRYGDQTLAAGEHVAPGFSRACCVNLYVCTYKVINYQNVKIQSEYTWSL